MQVSDFDKKIAALESQIADLEKQRDQARIDNKRRMIFTGMATFVSHQTTKMPDFELADKARSMRMSEFLDSIARVFNCTIGLPLEAYGKTVAETLYVLDYVADEAKMDSFVDAANYDADGG